MKKSLLVLFCIAAVLAGCGGSGGAAAPAAAPAPSVAPTEAVPAAASMSVAGLVSYLSALLVAMADTLEPVDVSTVTPPVDDSVEPAVVD